jgi:diacylglycerol kinase family enzyme
MTKRRKRYGVIINEKAGTALGLDHEALTQGLHRIAKERGVDIDLVITEGKSIGSEITRLQKERSIDALIAGGGDGTVSTSAAQAMEAGLVFGVLPLGTMNYFARTLKMPLDPLQAFESLLNGKTASVDTGVVNDRLFLHFVSLGLQPEMIRERQSIGYKSRIGKIAASTRAFLRTVRRVRRLQLDARLGEEHVICPASALIVSNNVINNSLPPIADRLDEGVLGVYLVKSHHWLDLLRLSKDAIIGRWKESAVVEVRTAQSVTINRASHRRRGLKVSIDGELHKFTGVIEIDIKPKSLKVLVPREQAA